MITYSAPYARMRALKGNLLTRIQMESLLQASDLQSIIAILSQTDYNDQIQNLTTSSQIEHGLKQNLILSYTKILNFMRGKSSRFIIDSLGRFELINTKSIIRSIIRGERIEDRSLSVFSLGKYHLLPIKELIVAKDLRTFVELMRNTFFANALEIGFQRYESESNLMSLEIALDLGYYARLHESFESLGLFDKSRAGKLMGIHFDMINITWMLRFKENYGLSSEQIFQYLLPYGWRVQPPVFWKILGSDDILSALRERYMRPYDKVLSSVSPVDGNLILGTEIALLRFFYEQSILALRGFPLQIASLVGFFIMKEMEIRDIMTILDGKILNLSQERIRPHLITIKG